MKKLIEKKKKAVKKLKVISKAKRGADIVADEMHEFKKGELRSGSKKGPIVKNPKQAIAIALSVKKKKAK